MTGVLLAFDDERALATRLAAEIGCPLALVATHRFPDGETKLTLPASLPGEVVMLRGLQHRPNDRLAELLIAAPAARELGARRLTLVAPYLAYMRQDIAFAPGEAVSQRHVGRALAAWFDAVVSVDPHLHRVATLVEVVPGRRAVALSAAPLWGDWLARHAGDAPLLLGPDGESAQWVRAAAAVRGLDEAVCRKVRHGDREIAIELPADARLAGRAVVLLDDVASTGRTLAEAARLALGAGAASVDVAVTHALFVGDALEQLRMAGVRHVWSSDAVEHPSNVLSIAPLVAAALAA